MVNTLEEQKLRVAILRAAELLIENGLGDWKIKLNRKRLALAETYYADKTITFSKYFVKMADKEQLEGVTLHEATHALLGPGHGHGDKFVKKCTEISPNTDYAKATSKVPILKYILTCPECGISGGNNKASEVYCIKCWDNDKTVKFNVEKNKIEVRMW